MKLGFSRSAATLLAIFLTIGCQGTDQQAGNGELPVADQSSPAQPASVDDPVERGRRAYFKHCVACHSPDTDEYIAGNSLKGYFDQPPTELSDGTLFPRTDEAIRNLIAEGTQNMPPLMKGITPQELDDILTYVHSL